MRLLRAAVADMPLFRVNLLEAERPGPSYTCETLARYRTGIRTRPFFFSWGCGPDEPGHLEAGIRTGAFRPLAVMAREGLDLDRWRRFWPGRGRPFAVPRSLDEDSVASGQVRAAWTIAGGHALYFLNIPRLDISSSLLRERWRRGGTLRFLAPDAVCRELAALRDEVDRAWGRDVPAGGRQTCNRKAW